MKVGTAPSLGISFMPNVILKLGGTLSSPFLQKKILTKGVKLYLFNKFDPWHKRQNEKAAVTVSQSFSLYKMKSLIKTWDKFHILWPTS